MTKLSKNNLKTLIPTRLIGPIKINFFPNSKKTKKPGFLLNPTEEISVPLATLEQPLWPSVSRGAKISRLTSGISLHVLQDNMTRSILVESNHAEEAVKVINELPSLFNEIAKVVKNTSNHCLLQNWHSQLVGNLLFLRFSFTTAEASGHNMTSKAAEAILTWLLNQYPFLKYVSVSGNYCTDKKVSAVNGILGRGKYVIAELLIPREICEQHLRTTPENIVNLNNKKNLIGSILAGSTRSANAHFANMLLAFYLATGQDAANIVEGSQGITYAEIRGDSLYFSVTLPNLILGVYGSGKNLPEFKKRMAALGCNSTQGETGHNAKRLAMIAAATVLCGELSLLAALTVRGELIKTHLQIERKNK